MSRCQHVHDPDGTRFATYPVRAALKEDIFVSKQDSTHAANGKDDTHRCRF